MDINQLIEIVKANIENNIKCEQILIKDQTHIHKNHKTNTPGKFHLKITIISEELKNKRKIDGTRLIYKSINSEIEKYIHSLQLNIN